MFLAEAKTAVQVGRRKRTASNGGEPLEASLGWSQDALLDHEAVGACTPGEAVDDDEVGRAALRLTMTSV